MTIQIDVYWLVGLVAIMATYKPTLAAAIGVVKTAVKAWKFAEKYVELPGQQHDLELRVDDLEHAVFPGDKEKVMP